MPRQFSRIFVQSYQDYDLKCWWLGFLSTSPSICRANTIHSHRPFSTPRSCPTSRTPLLRHNVHQGRSRAWKGREILGDSKQLPGGRRFVRVLSCKYPVRRLGKSGSLRRLGSLSPYADDTYASMVSKQSYVAEF